MPVVVTAMPDPFVSVIGRVADPVFSVDSGAMSYRADGSDKGRWDGMTMPAAAPSNTLGRAGKSPSVTCSGNRNEPATKQDAPHLPVKTTLL